MKKIITLILVAVLMISFAVVANAAVGTVVKAQKVDKAPNLEFIDESWGDPVIKVTPDSYNAELYKYWTEYIDTGYFKWEGTGPNGRTTIEPENCPFDLYLCWDNKYLYVGVLSPEYEICGADAAWAGDGVQIWVQPLETLVAKNMTNTGFFSYDVDQTTPAVRQYQLAYDAACDYYWTLSFDDYSVSNHGAAAECEKYITIEDDMMHATIAIPLSNLGLNAKKMNLHGYELGTGIVRMSSRSTFDEGLAGWLSWGKFYEYGTADSLNTIVLVDPAQGDVTPDTTPVATEPVVTEPVVTEPVVTEPVATEPVATEPVVTEPVVTEPVATEPVVTEPVATEPVVTEPVVTEPVVTEPVATEPVETEPVETEPVATEPVETDAPETEAPVVETEAPVVETEAPVVETEAPVVETEAPATEAPKAEEPAEKNNTGLIIAIVAAVVVVGAVVGIVLGKKKK